MVPFFRRTCWLYIRCNLKRRRTSIGCIAVEVLPLSIAVEGKRGPCQADAIAVPPLHPVRCQARSLHMCWRAAYNSTNIEATCKGSSYAC